MTNEFLVKAKEIVLLSERDFVTHGGEDLHFGSLAGDTVRLYTTGSRDAIRWLATSIIAHHTAAG
jgi:hypothetical protein